MPAMNSVAKTTAWLAAVSRPARRHVAPLRFKETYINRALARYDDPTYLEIGVRQGESFRIAEATRKVGIDPARTKEMAVLKSGEEFFATTSDEFFSTYSPEVLGRQSVHVALIDGLHEFRQVSRDLLNLEPYMCSDGIIFLDDVNPRTRQRSSASPIQGAWNGDVWKIAAFLSRGRPDLQFWTVDADEGVGMVAGLGGQVNSDLDDILEGCSGLDYDYLDQNRKSLLHLIGRAEFDEVLAALAPV